MNESNRANGVIQELNALIGTEPPGTPLPPVRELIKRHHVSASTVRRVVARLVADGKVVTRPGQGTFVATAKTVAAPADFGWQQVTLGQQPRYGDNVLELVSSRSEPDAIPMSGGYLDASLQPTDALAKATSRAARRPGVWGAVPVAGLLSMRRWFASQVGGNFDARDILITSGGQAALSLAFRTLAKPGDTILVESPTYLGAFEVARSAGLRVVPVPCDEYGLRPDLLEHALQTTGARLLYMQPLHANPTGATLASERRSEVLRLLAETNAFCVEDDIMRDLTFVGTAQAPLANDDRHGHVVYVRSLTKCASPGLRVACVAARGPAGARLRAMRVIEDFFVPGVLQEATVDLVSSPAWQRHLRAVRSALKERHDATLAAVKTLGPQVEKCEPSRGGFHLWLHLRRGLDDQKITEEALAAGVAVSAGRLWYPTEASGPKLRVTFGGAESGELIQGIERLRSVLDAH